MTSQNTAKPVNTVKPAKGRTVDQDANVLEQSAQEWSDIWKRFDEVATRINAY